MSDIKNTVKFGKAVIDEKKSPASFTCLETAVLSNYKTLAVSKLELLPAMVAMPDVKVIVAGMEGETVKYTKTMTVKAIVNKIAISKEYAIAIAKLDDSAPFKAYVDVAEETGEQPSKGKKAVQDSLDFLTQ